MVATEFDQVVERYRVALRELTDASKALRALCSAKNREAAEQLRRSIASDDRHEQALDLGVIQTTVSEHFGIQPSLMQSADRPNYIAHPRQIAMFLARELTRRPLEKIGDFFGGRDHGTVIHAIHAVSNRAELEPNFRARLDLIRESVRAALGLGEPKHG